MEEVILESSFATGADIDAVLSAVEPTFRQFPPDHVLLACLYTCFVIMHPSIDLDEVIAGVDGASTWIANYIAALVGGPTASVGVPTTKMN